MKRIKEVINRFHDLDQRDLEIFISEILDKNKSFVISHWEQEISLFQYLKLLYNIHLRKKGYSVAAIVRHKEFYSLDFFVNKEVLIPRPETELMVEEVLRIMNDEVRTKNEKIILIDVGTGSGCIPISILKNIKGQTQTFAIDISKSALRIAKKNAKKHSVDIQFIYGNLFEPFLSLRGVPTFRDNQTIFKLTLPNPRIALLPKAAHNDTIIITANLPYLTEQQFQNEPSIQQEPKKALVTDNNGLALYEELLQQISSLISNFKFPLYAFLEIDPSQTESISKIIQQNLPTANFEIKKDLAGLDRLVKIMTN
jgi:release factor glutamine methyltransferase